MDSEKHLYVETEKKLATPSSEHLATDPPRYSFIDSSKHPFVETEKHLATDPSSHLNTDSEKHLLDPFTTSTPTLSPSSSAIKTYTLIRHGRQTDFQFFDANNNLILTSSTIPATFKTGTTNTLHAYPSGDTLAVCSAKRGGWSSHSSLLLGSPTTASPSDSTELHCDRRMRESKYSFSHNNKKYTWRRTHDKEYGSRRRSFRDFKMVEEETGVVLAVWVDNDGCSGILQSSGARLSFYGREMDKDLESISLVALLRIEDHIRNSEQAAILAS